MIYIVINTRTQTIYSIYDNKDDTIDCYIERCKEDTGNHKKMQSK